MEAYQEMYLKLFNAATDAIRALRRGDTEFALYRLMQAQYQAEEIYLDAGE